VVTGKEDCSVKMCGHDMVMDGLSSQWRTQPPATHPIPGG